MKWYEIEILTTGEASEAVQNMLTDMGAKGCEIVEPYQNIENSYGSNEFSDEFNEKMWFPSKVDDVIIIRAWFYREKRQEQQDNLIKKAEDGIRNISKYLKTGAGNINIQEKDDEDWANNWKQYYKQFMITPRFLIKPSWEIEPDNARDSSIMVVQMDPGMAFGTGTHDTTVMCAEYLDESLKKYDYPIVVDAGCGSGILSIIAAIGGAKRVIAFDPDPVAVQTTLDNSKRNNTVFKTEIIQGEIDCLKYRNVKADIFAANIIADVIIDILPLIPDYLDENGIFIGAGIICNRLEDVINASHAAGINIVSTKYKGKWVAFKGIKNR